MRDTRLRWPAFAVGLVLVVICCAFTPFNNVKLQNSPLAGGHFPLASFACLIGLLAVVNPLLGLISRRWRFTLHEVFLIWSMVAVAAGMAYTGLLRTFIINITSPQWLGTAAGNVGVVLQPLLSPALFPGDMEMIRTIYGGLEGGLDMPWWEIFRQIPWHVWFVPLLWWGLFMALVTMAMIGFVGLFSHQWIENEKMSFPLLRVVEVLTQESEEGRLGAFFTHRLFLLGLSIPLLLHLFNGLHTYYPQMPQFPTLILAQPYIPKEGLLSGFYKTKIYIYPAFIGFAFLASKQVSFSFWFFYFLGALFPGLLQVVGWRLPAAALGTTFGPIISRVEEMQMIGAFLVFSLFILWLARDHLRMIFGSLIGRPPLEENFHGFLPPRPAMLLLAVGLAGTAGWLMLFGMDPLATLLFLGISFMVQVVASRLICQGGLPYFTLAVAPSDGFLAFFNTKIIAPMSLYLGVVVQKVTFLDMRESLMPSLFHGSKLADGSSPRARFLGGLIAALVVGLTVSFAAMLILYYKFGINTLPDEWAVETARRVHENTAQLLSHPEEPKYWSMVFTIIGGALMTLLVMGYHHFIWWPLHPIGYLTAYTSAMQTLWFGFFVGWLCNTLVLRYGGVSMFKEVRQLFIGLVVGDMLMAVVWLVVGLFSSQSYHVLPL